jgi:hypothetical protein
MKPTVLNPAAIACTLAGCCCLVKALVCVFADMEMNLWSEAAVGQRQAGR